MSGEDEETKGNAASRKEKRKLLKKQKRKEKRKDIAEKERQEEEIKLNDPEEQRRVELLEQEEKERVERERKEFEERERLWMENMMMKKQEEEEEERKLLGASIVEKAADQDNHSDDWEYVEEGPAEIIWKGNEIIVKKKQVKVPKKQVVEKDQKEDAERPTSNPLPPQSEAFTDHMGVSMGSVEHAYENVAQQVPHFGTEQDKAHCPFHIKTGACRFGSRCSRVHFYPDKSCTLLIKNMYSGPGLAWEQDEGLEVCEWCLRTVLNSSQDLLRWRSWFWPCLGVQVNGFVHSYTDEEIEKCYEEFYEDVHTEFLKFGEIVNFKVCRNGSFHLRGNVYVHYKFLDSAMLAYQSLNGRYFAGKQVKCEFVGVTKWKIAICGEYMKSRLKTCSRGTACNFIHCFLNPGGDYEWADWDKSPPKYWMEKMASLFGHSDGYVSEKYVDQESPGHKTNIRRKATPDSERYYSRRSSSRSRDRDSHRSLHKENNSGKSTRWQRHMDNYTVAIEVLEREDIREIVGNFHQVSRSRHQADSDGDYSYREKYSKSERYCSPKRKSCRGHGEVSNFLDDDDETDSEGDLSCRGKDHDRDKHHRDKKKSSRHRSKAHDNYYSDKEKKTRDPSSDEESSGSKRCHTSKNSSHKRKCSRDHDRKQTPNTDSDRESLENVRYHRNKNSSHKRKASKDHESLGDRKKMDVDSHKHRRGKRRKSSQCLDHASRMSDEDSTDWKRKSHHADSGDGLSDEQARRYYKGSSKYSGQESEVSGICSDRWNPE